MTHIPRECFPFPVATCRSRALLFILTGDNTTATNRTSAYADDAINIKLTMRFETRLNFVFRALTMAFDDALRRTTVRDLRRSDDSRRLISRAGGASSGLLWIPVLDLGPRFLITKGREGDSV